MLFIYSKQSLCSFRLKRTTMDALFCVVCSFEFMNAQCSSANTNKTQYKLKLIISEIVETN